MFNMFTGCSSLSSLDVTSFDTSNVTRMDDMFYNCSSLSSLDVTSFDTRNVTDMSGMFYNCSSLSSLDLTSFDTRNVTNMRRMFSGCGSLSSLDLSNMDLSQLQNAEYMFLSFGRNLTWLNTPINLHINIPLYHTLKDASGNEYFSLPCNLSTSMKLESKIASGTYCGMDWIIDKDGLLTIKGEYQEDAQTGTSWQDYCNQIKNAKVTATGVQSTKDWFKNCFYLLNVDLSNFDTSQVTDMGGMFYDCSSLTNLDVSNFDTSQVTDMGGMFYDCSALTNLDVSNFDTSQVTNMNGMFHGCRALTSLDVSNFNTNQVTDMGGMFYVCSSLTNLDVSNFNTCQATDMSSMFCGCSSLTNLDLSNFNMSNVTNVHMGYMFDGCDSFIWLKTPKKVSLTVYLPFKMQNSYGDDYTILPKNFEESVQLWGKTDDVPLPAGTWYGMDWTIDNEGLLTISGKYQENGACTKNWRYFGDRIKHANITATGVQSTKEWFKNCSNLTDVDLSNFDTSQVTDMSGMFCGCEALYDLNVSNFDTHQVTDMSSMFAGCESLIHLDVSNFNTSNVTDMSSMFRACYALTSLDVSNFNTSNVTDMSSMFCACYALTSLDVSNFNTSNVTDMNCMFAEHHWYGEFTGSLSSLDVSNFDTSNVIDMSYMFSGCALTDLDVSNFNTSKVTNMEGMFYECSLLPELDVTNFDTCKVTNVYSMFSQCKSLTSLDLSNMDFSKIEDWSDIGIRSCQSLQWIQTPINLSVQTVLPAIMGDEQGNTYITLPREQTVSIRLTKTLGKSEEIIASGTWYGIDWAISGDGSLDISGTYNEQSSDDYDNDYDKVIWDCYSHVITSAKVTAINIQYMYGWFGGCRNLQSIDFIDFDTSNITDMDELFYNCRSLTNLDLSNMNLTKLIWAESMFYHCDNLEWINTPINLNIDIDLPYTMVDADGNTYSTLPRGLTTSIKLTKPSTGGEPADKPEDKPDNQNIIASETYYGMNWSLNKDGLLAIEGEYQENAQSSIGWDAYAEQIISARVTASNVKSTRAWFKDCSNLLNVDLMNLDASQVIDMSSMFGGCRSLTSVDLSNMNLSRLKSADNMLASCDSLEWISTPKNLSISIALPFPMSDADGKTYSALPLNQTVSNKLTPKGDGLAIIAIADQSYTGKAIKPSVTVTYGKRALTPGVDYTVTYKNNTNAAAADSAKAPTVIVKGKGNYTDSITETFTILAKPLTEANTTIASMAYTTDGKAKKPTPTVTVDGTKLKSGKDYIVEFPDTVSGAYQQPGRYNVTIKGTGNYQGMVMTTMAILTKDQILASKLKIGKLPTCTYIEGTPATPVPAVTYAGKTLERDKDYTITYRNNDKTGKATLIITGLENTDPQGIYVHGTVEKTFTIKGTALSKAKVTYDNKADFTGQAICPAVTLTLNGAALRPGTDYTVSYSNNINAGKASITLTGCGGYTGTVKKTFTIRPAQAAADKLEVDFENGSAEASYSQSGAKPAVTVKIGENILQSGKDYTLTYKNNKKLAASNAAKAPTIIVKGKGNYRFQKSVTFSIVEKSLNDADIIIAAPDTFLGAKGSLLAAPAVTDGNGKKLKSGRDYTVTGYFINGKEFDGRGKVSSNTSVTVKLRGTGSYTGETEAVYRIASKNIAKTNAVISPIEFNGGTTVLTDQMIQEGKIKVTDKTTGQELIYGTDYIITSYKNNAKKGKATLTIQGIGENYGGTKTVKFSITAMKFKK
ncbi:MAG: BspA family leucine-rich repeat surface protein [Lachnospiraceae bacterium]|nr:BspA family leucine-rich repeat surface protein [Lachnospiraceae bacterium]